MADIANIGFKADTNELERAEQKLNDLAPAAERVQKSADGVEKSMKKTDSALGKAARGASVTDRAFGSLNGNSRKLSENAMKAGNEFDSLKRSLDPAYASSRKLDDGIEVVNRALAEQVITAGEADRAISQLNQQYGKSAQRIKKLTQIAKVGGAVLGAFVIGMGTKATNEFKAFDSALAETSTLIEGNAEQMTFITEQAKLFAGTFGGSATDQVQGFYSAISAGATDVKTASQILEQSNKLAVGGVTSTEAAVDVLTTVVNSYGSEVITASKASDVLFGTVKLGKTTADELASSLSGVLSTAASLSVPFEDVGAAMATLTSKGVPTSQAVTSLNAALAGISAPTSQAKELAEKLGIEFSATALESKGLSGVLKDVMEKTGGSADQLAILFGSIEARKAVVNLAANDFKTLDNNIVALQGSAGATDEAFNKMSESLSFRLDAALAKINADMLGTGGTIMQYVVPATELLAENVDILIPLVAGLTAGTIALGVAMSLNPIGAAVAGVAALTGGIIYLNQRLPELTENFDGLSPPLRGALQTFELLKTNGGAALDWLGNGISMVANLVSGDLQGAMNDANDMTEAFQRSSLGKLEKSARTAVQGWRDEMKAGFSKWYDESKTKVSDFSVKVVRWAVDGFDELPEQMMQVGKDAIRGLMRGIASMGDAVIEKGKEIGRNALSGVKDFLKIQSPSKEMAKLGQFAGMGLAVGLTASTPAVANSAVDLASTMTESFQAQINQQKAIIDLSPAVEQNAQAYALLERQFNALGMTVPQNTASLRAFVAGLDVSTQSGQTLMTQLQTLIPEFDRLRGSGLQADLLGVNQELGGQFGQGAEIEQLQIKLDGQAQILQAARETQLLNEQEYQDRLNAIKAMGAVETQRIMQQSNLEALSAASSGFASIASASKDFAGEQSALYKTMFAASKAFAIAESIIKIQQGVASALSLPFPANFAAMAAVAAEGANIVSAIQSVQAAGFKDGGLIGGVGTGTSDDNLIRASRGEFMMKAKSVQSIGHATLEQANKTGKLPTGGGGAVLNVQVINNAPGVEHEVQQISDTEVRVIARQEIEKAVPKKMAQEAANPSSEFSKTMQNSKGVGQVR